MLLLAVVFVCLTQAEIRKVNFKKADTTKHTIGIHFPVSCGSVCLAGSNCRSFVITKNMQQCLISTENCQGDVEGICYQRNDDVHKEEKKDQLKKAPSQHSNREEKLLIVAAYVNRIPKMYDFRSKTITDYPTLKLGKIRCMVSMPVSHGLLVGALLPERIQIHSGGAGAGRIIAHFKAGVLAVDEVMQRVFVIKYRTGELYLTTLDTRKAVKRIFKSESALNDMALNVKAQTLYLASSQFIYMTSYDSKVLKTLSKDTPFNNLAFDDHHHILYYSDNVSIGKVSKDEKKLKKIFDKSTVNTYMIYHRGSLFLSGEGRDRLCKVIVNWNQNSCRPLFGSIYREDQRLLIAVIKI